MIEWDPTDVLTCMEAEPVIDEEAGGYQYTLDRESVVVVLDVWPYADDVWLTVRVKRHQNPLIDLRMHACREIRYIRDDGREELHFVSHDDRPYDPANIRGGWRLQVRPGIEVKLGHPQAG